VIYNCFIAHQSPPMPFTVREVLLAIALVAIFVGAFVNCQVAAKALRTTQKLTSATAGDAK
jgi:hypothetical protein